MSGMYQEIGNISPETWDTLKNGSRLQYWPAIAN